MPSVDDWAEFLGKGNVSNAKRITGTKDYTEPTVKVAPLTQVTIEDRLFEHLPGPAPRSLAWSIQAEHPRVCFICKRLIPNGSQAVHVGPDTKRGLHIRCIEPDRWGMILGQPRGGDAKIMGQFRARLTREAKKGT